MPLTQAKDMEAFDHMLNVVFRVPKVGPLYKALTKSGDTDIRDILLLDETDIDSLTYNRSDTEKDIPLSRWDKVLIHIFKHYILHHSSIGLPIGFRLRRGVWTPCRNAICYLLCLMLQ